MERSLRIWYVLIIVWLALAVPTVAQQSSRGGGTSGIGFEGWGVRLGGSSDPDQVYGGVHFDLGEFAPDVRFRPTVEIGSGDDATVLQALAEAHYVFSKVQVWRPYLGGGAGWTWIDLDDVPPGRDDSDSDLALMAIAGLETKLRSGTLFFFELKIGLGDEDPDLKLGLGWGW